MLTRWGTSCCSSASTFNDETLTVARRLRACVRLSRSPSQSSTCSSTAARSPTRYHRILSENSRFCVNYSRHEPMVFTPVSTVLRTNIIKYGSAMASATGGTGSAGADAECASAFTLKARRLQLSKSQHHRQGPYSPGEREGFRTRREREQIEEKTKKTGDVT